MKNLFASVYIKPDKNYVITQYKSYQNGPLILSAPLSYYDAEEWNNLGKNVARIVKDMCANPTCNQEDKTVLKTLLKGKSWKNFTKCFLCIDFLYNPATHEYIVSNQPREIDGGYGVTKGKLTEHYSTHFEHVTEENLQKYAELAYKEGLAYLRALNEPWCQDYLAEILQKQ